MDKIDKIYKIVIMFLLIVITISLSELVKTQRYYVSKQGYIYVIYDKLDGSFSVTHAPIKEMRGEYESLQRESNEAEEAEREFNKIMNEGL